jgi:hypothetical protein
VKITTDLLWLSRLVLDRGGRERDVVGIHLSAVGPLAKRGLLGGFEPSRDPEKKPIQPIHRAAAHDAGRPSKRERNSLTFNTVEWSVRVQAFPAAVIACVGVGDDRFDLLPRFAQPTGNLRGQPYESS